jgi:hypothetical protein
MMSPGLSVRWKRDGAAPRLASAALNHIAPVSLTAIYSPLNSFRLNKDDRLMKTVIVALGLVFLTAGSARAVSVPCETFAGSDTHAPQFVRDYLDDSKQFFVRVCGLPPDREGLQVPAYYYAASSPVRDGNVCRYTTHELNFLNTSPPRLERTAASPQTLMLVSESLTCPSPGTGNYAATNNVPQDVFEHLVCVWRAAVSSPASIDGTVSSLSDAAVLSRLRDTILQGKSDRLVVKSTRLRQYGLWKGYEVFVADPDRSDRSYVVIILSVFGLTDGIWYVAQGWD